MLLLSYAPLVLVLKMFTFREPFLQVKISVSLLFLTKFCLNWNLFNCCELSQVLFVCFLRDLLTLLYPNNLTCSIKIVLIQLGNSLT